MKYRLISEGQPSSAQDFGKFGVLREEVKDYVPVIWCLETDKNFANLDDAKIDLEPIQQLVDGSWSTRTPGVVWIPYRRSE